MKLPEDLNKIELWYIIDYLTTKFNLQNFANIAKLINETKLAVTVLLRQDWWEEKLEQIKTKYNIPEDFIEKVENQEITFWEKREFVKKIKEKRQENWVDKKTSENSTKLWKKPEDLENTESEIDKLYKQEFDLTFFRKWVNLLRYWMETITQIEIEQRKKYLEENWYKKEIKYWKTYYTKWDNKISFLDKKQDIDKQEQKLRDKIWIEKLKQELEKARQEWNQEQINKLEIKAANKILETIREFPFTYIENNYWYQPNKIAEHKEIYCVWFTLLGHAFLSELWIKHNWLDIPSHSALEVIIWWEKYYFDGTYSDKIIEYNYDEKDKICSYYKTSLDATTQLLVHSWNPEKILLSQMLNNKWASLYDLWEYKEAIKMYDKAIELNPSYANAYNNKWAALHGLWRDKEAYLYAYTSEILKWNKNNQFEKKVNYEHKDEIINFIENKDFEGLRKYLLDLERK